MGSSRESAAVTQLLLHFIYVLFNGEWTVSDHLLIVPPRYQWDCSCRISDDSLKPPALLTALGCSSSEYTLFPLGFLSLDTSELPFCLSEIVTTWELTSWLLSSNWELPAVHEILLACNPTGHSICQSPAESDHALRYSELVTRLTVSGSDFWDSGCVFERLFSQQQMVPSLILLFGSGDSTWHKKTHFLITFHSFLSITLFNSLHVVCWLQVLWLYTLSLHAHTFVALVHHYHSREVFLCNLGQLYWLILCDGQYWYLFPPLKHPVGLSKPFDFQLFYCDFLTVPFSTCLAISDLADTSIRIVYLTHLLLSF